MIFRFADNKGLTFAYAELLEVGLPKSSIAACFEESAPVPRPPAVHQSFLQHLHSWFVAAKAHQEPDSRAEEKTDAPVSATFRAHGGTLEVNSRDRAAEVIAIAIHHYGEMVG